MFLARVNFKIKPELHASFMAVVDHTTKTALAQPGCNYFGFYRDLEESHSYLFTEEWATQADYDAFKQSSVFAELSKIFSMLDGEPSATYFSAEYISQ
jgi:quinol monooxygenase YgiN